MINGNGEIRMVGNTWHDLNSRFALLFVQQGGPCACVRACCCRHRVVSCRVATTRERQDDHHEVLGKKSLTRHAYQEAAQEQTLLLKGWEGTEITAPYSWKKNF